LHSISDGTNGVTYQYLADSELIGQVEFATNGGTVMTTTKSYDYLNRRISISSACSAFSAVSFTYSYNSANQRTLRREADGSYWRYEYDPLGQVTSGKKFWPDMTPVAGQQFEHGFDDIGNRTSTKAGGDENGFNLRAANYGANLLNQYTNRTVPGFLDIIGLAFATNQVYVNGQTPYRKGEYFRAELPIDNSSAPVWTNIEVTADGQAPVSGHRYLPQTPEQFLHDLDGNLTNDGRWSYTWDAENRLVKMAANSATGPQISLAFEYDSKGRRIRKQVWSNPTWSGNPTNDLRFLYDDWNLIAILNSDFSILTSFTWGLDLSGSLQGAGGVGGLLAVTIHHGPNLGTYFCCYDGNGNVVALANAADGVVAGQWEYDAFGNVLRATGPMAKSNPFLFSTKYYDWETGLYYYGYRYYDPSMGRWPNRDPINELGFNLLIRSQNPFNLDEEKNLYGFVRNNPVTLVDSDGRAIPILGIVAAWAAWQGVCAYLAANKAVEAFPGDDKKQHCFASCFHNRCTGLFQPIFTLIGGALWELRPGCIFRRISDSDPILVGQ
jgi:RHS repeat-associated protein